MKHLVGKAWSLQATGAHLPIRFRKGSGASSWLTFIRQERGMFQRCAGIFPRVNAHETCTSADDYQQMTVPVPLL